MGTTEKTRDDVAAEALRRVGLAAMAGAAAAALVALIAAGTDSGKVALFVLPAFFAAFGIVVSSV